ncbi:hypothetical protein PGT21_004380 [Puccinia graminis f. sp. tritici]|uniref:Uncharacterized protein n=1 Tax=Puccinia graminis f. sp. tritici TaxID=56615 RepID=A0A5B0MAM7_PUCGR|nr:hypothetical protein PGT21_004380 [Puccinia graminis f. sp. tritici]
MISDQTTTPPDETPSIYDLIINALNSTLGRYNQTDNFLPPEDWRPVGVEKDTVWVHSIWKYARPEAHSIDEIKHLNQMLLQAQTTFLPLLQQQLVELLESLHPANLSKLPNSKSHDALKILSQLGHTIDHINSFVHSISPITVNLLRPPETNDHNYGNLKTYRASKLIYEIKEIMRNDIAILFGYVINFIEDCSNNAHISSLPEDELIHDHAYLVRETKTITDTYIHDLIKLSKQSDFGIIQDHCRTYVRGLDETLTDLIRAISKTKTRSKRHRRLTESGPNHLTGSAQDNSLISQRFISLANTALPMIKLLRTLFNKLSNTPIRKAPFTIGTQLSSTEITALDEELGDMHGSSILAFNFSYHINFHEDPVTMDKVRSLENSQDDLNQHFDSSIILLLFHLMPLSEDEVDLPKPCNPCTNWFFRLREQFCLASRNFSQALHDLKIATQL